MSTNDKDLLEALEDLNKALESAPVYTAPPIVMDDVYDKVEPFLSPLSRQLMAQKATTLIEVDEETGVIYKCIFLGIQVAEKNLELAYKAMALEINKLSELGLIRSTLARPTLVPLAKMPLKVPTFAFITYVLVPAEEEKNISQKVKFVVQEGEVGESLGSLDIELVPGEFLYETHISHWYTDRTKASPEQMVQYEIDQLLAILPKGTEVKSITKCAIVSLSVPFEVIFFNPLMAKYKEVKMDYKRDCELVDGHLDQFNLLTGIQYIKR